MVAQQIRFFTLFSLLLFGTACIFAGDTDGTVDSQSVPPKPVVTAGTAGATGATETVRPVNPFMHRKRIAVVDFDVPPMLRHRWGHDGEAAAAHVGSLLSDMFTTALTNSGAFDVVERAELKRILYEQHLVRDAILDPASAPRLGKILGVDMILGGKITEFGIKNSGGAIGIPGFRSFFAIGLKKSTARVVVDARLIDSSTAKILMTESGIGENSEQSLSFAGADFDHFVIAANINDKEWAGSRIGHATREAVEHIVATFAANFPVEASVVAVLPDGAAVLNIGRFAGIKPGDKFDIAQVSQVLDPNTKEVIYEDHKILGTLQVLEVQDNGCKATLTADSAGNSIHVNDIAILRKVVPPSPPKKSAATLNDTM